MAVTYRPWETTVGEYGTHYHFDKTGEGISMHAHVNPETYHSTRCVKGSVEIYGDVPTRVLAAGETAVFKSYRMHEIAALQDDTEIVNVLDHGKPKDYEGVPIATLSGCVEPVLMGRHAFSD